METLISLLGIGILFGLGILLSFERHQISWRTVGFALLLQFALGGIALYFPLGVAVLEAISNAVSSVLNNAQDGIDFGSFPVAGRAEVRAYYVGTALGASFVLLTCDTDTALKMTTIVLGGFAGAPEVVEHQRHGRFA